MHYYNDSGLGKKCNDVTNEKAKAIIDDLAEFGVPSILFSGGEPLMREDLFDLIQYANDKGLRTVISTNGTLITADKAKLIKKSCVSYVGISLDGTGPINDKFRGAAGAFERAVRGIRNCKDLDIRVGLRLTLTQKNLREREKLFDFFEKENAEQLIAICLFANVIAKRTASIMRTGLWSGHIEPVAVPASVSSPTGGI